MCVFPLLAQLGFKGERKSASAVREMVTNLSAERTQVLCMFLGMKQKHTLLCEYRCSRWKCMKVFICLILSLHNALNVTAYYPDYQTYHNLQSISDELASLALDFPSLVQLHTIGTSRQNRPIFAVNLFDTHRARACSPPTVILTSGEHAREFIPVEALLVLMRNLTKAAIAASPDHAEILQRVRVIAVPMANPDGRGVVEQQGNWCWRGMSNGVDINRNFPWEFGGLGSSADPNNEEFKGPSPLSEPESRAISSIFNSSSPPAAYASLHSGSQVIYTPYSDSVSKRMHRLPSGSASAVNLAVEMAAQSGMFYTETGVVYEKNDYTADGTVSDWASAVMQVPLVFTFEMFGDPKAGDLSNCFEQFNPESAEVSKCVQKQLPALLFLLRHVARDAELECELRSLKATVTDKISSEAAAAVHTEARASPRQGDGGPMKQDIVHDMHILSRDIQRAQAALQQARQALVASLRARGVSK